MRCGSYNRLNKNKNRKRVNINFFKKCHHSGWTQIFLAVQTHFTILNFFIFYFMNPDPEIIIPVCSVAEPEPVEPKLFWGAGAVIS